MYSPPCAPPALFKNLFFVPKGYDFFQTVSDLLVRESWTHLILPHKKAIAWLYRAFRPQALILPKILTPDTLLGYKHSALLSRCPVSYPQALYWMTSFLKKSDQPIETWVPCASLMIRLWEMCHLYEDEPIEKHLSLLVEKTWLHQYMATWKKICDPWSRFIKRQGFYSQAQAQKEASEILMQRWEKAAYTPKILVVGLTTIPPHLKRLFLYMMETQPESYFLFPEMLWTDFPFSPRPWQPPLPHQAPLTKQVACHSTIEQARMIGILIRESLESCQKPVALVCASPLLKACIQQEIKRWYEPTFTDCPLLSFLVQILEVVLAHAPFQEILALARHPLMLRAHPIALTMAFHAERLHIHNVKPEEGPRWLRRAHSFIQKALSPFHTRWKKNLVFSKWMDAHIQSLWHMIPYHLWQEAEHILWKMRKIKTKQFSLQEYAGWFKVFSGVSDTPHSKDLAQKIYLCAPEDLPLLSHCRHIIAHEKPIENSNRMAQESALYKPASDETIVVTPSASACVYDHWAKALDEPLVTDWAVDKAMPTPPLYRLSLSDLQLWQTDFKAFYKRRVLHLRPSLPSSHQIWGMAVHRLLESFIQKSASIQSYEGLLEELRAIAQQFLVSPHFIHAHRTDRLLQDIARCEWTKRTQYRYTSRTEVDGYLTFHFPEGAIKLTARADRLDDMEDGSVHIIDYKTGAVPSFLDLERLASLQLPLEAIFVEEGALGRKAPVSEISWWHLTLRGGCQIKTYPRSIKDLLMPYRECISTWLRAFVRGDYGK